MANVIKTVLTYTLDGATTDYNIPFEYLARKFVVVTLIGTDRKVLVLNTDYRFATRNVISLTKAWGPADGYQQIELRRVTSATERLVDFTDGSILRAYDLNVAQIQTMHIAEEARDLTADTIGVNNEGDLDARGRRIVNLAYAVNDNDAVPFGQLKGLNQNAWQARNEAKQFRDEAEAFKQSTDANATATRGWRDEAEGFRNEALKFRNEAEGFKTNASNSATSASNSATLAANSRDDAAESADSARTEAGIAKGHADRAEEEANKLQNNNAFAGTLESVTAPTGADKWDGAVNFKNEYAVNAPTLRATKGGLSLGRDRESTDPNPRTFINLYNGTTSLGSMLFNDDGSWKLTTGGASRIHLDTNVVQANTISSGYHEVGTTIGNPLGMRLRCADPVDTLNQTNMVFHRYELLNRGGNSGEASAFSDIGMREVVGQFHETFIHMAGFNHDKWWGFRGDGSICLDGQVRMGADGNMFGPAYGDSWITDWIKANWSAHLITADPGYAAVWRANGIPEGWGRVITAAVNGNADDLLDGVHFRSLRNYWHTGRQDNIY